jgi:antitoxin ParD1/3/4
MNVSLTPQLEKFVNTKVKSGRYNSASEVVREALRLLEEHDRFRAQRLAEFRIAMDERLASLDRGEGVDGAEFIKTLEREEQALEAASRRKRA